MSRVLARQLEALAGHSIAQGSLDPTFHRDDLGRVGIRMVQPTDLPSSIEAKEVFLVDDVIFTGRTIRAALEALQAWGRPEKMMLLVMVDRGHRELPVQPDFCGREVPTSKTESIEVIIEKGLGTKSAVDDKTNDEVERVLQEHREGIEGSEEKKKQKQAKSDLTKSDKYKVCQRLANF